MQQVLSLLKTAKGMDFTHYKLPTVTRRIRRRMVHHGIERISDYAAYLRANEGEADKLYEDLLIKVTCFFRDPASFVALKTHVLPALFAHKEPGAGVRVWVPGCATGEEAYSIAMTVLEYLEEAGTSARIEIFATDLSESALAVARAGRYGASIRGDVSPERLVRFFTEDAGGFKVKAALREVCLFAKQNVARDPPFSRVDVISCRNLLIYLTQGLQTQILRNFHFALNPGGFLMLGHAESVGAATSLFGVEDKDSRIFNRLAISGGIASPQFAMAGFYERIPRQPADLPARSNPPAKLDLKSEAERAILSHAVGPGVVVNDRLEVVQFRGDTSEFLLNPSGDPTASLLKLCREGMLVGLRAALQEAASSNHPVKKDASLRTPGGPTRSAAVNVIPFQTAADGQRHFAVLFSAGSPRVPDAADESSPDGESEVERLRRELAATKEYLFAIIEKEQATNEELKSVSEEILSSNEELQSTNEEFATAKEETQAANEELITVNEELHSRNQELGQLNNDLANLFGSVQIPIVMLSETLCVRLFTPSAEKVLGVTAADVGKPLSAIAGSLSVAGIDRLAQEVVESLNTRESEVQDRSGRWYSLRVKPYRTRENKIEGAVIAMVDIDAIKTGYAEVLAARDYADAIVQTTPLPLLVLDGDLRVFTANRAFLHHFKVKAGETESLRIYDLGAGQWDIPALRRLLEEVLPSNERIEDYVIDEEFPGIGRRTMRLCARRLAQKAGKEARILLAIDDVTEETTAAGHVKAAKDAAEAANKAKSEFLANMSHEIRTPLGAILGYAELLLDPAQERSDAVHFASRIRRNIEQLTELVDEILDIAKVEAGKLDVERTRFKLLPELSEVFALLESRAKAQGLEFNVRFVGAIPETVFSCPKRLRQILLNIVGNALKFTEQGAVSVSVRLSPPGPETPKRLSFEVKDTGCGLSEEQQRRLFRPFSQADGSVTRKFGGTGLGLTLARRLAEALGGGVALTESQPGRGSTFTFDLDPGPLDGVVMLAGLGERDLQASPVADRERFAPSQRLAGMRVLLVEDGPDNQALMGHFLRQSGAVVDVAANGLEALEKASASAYDVVLMDIQMPELDGYEATRRLRAAGNETPIVALTAHAMGGEREKCQTVGCSDYLSKPVKANVLIDAVARFAKKKALSPAEGGAYGVAPERRFLQGVRVLVIDDAPDNQFVIRRYLESAGATVASATNGSEGVEMAKSTPHDVVLMDIQMPGELDGKEATAKLRHDDYRGPILALTAQLLKSTRDAARIGFDDYLTKPVDRKVLVAKVGAFAGRRSTVESEERPLH